MTPKKDDKDTTSRKSFILALGCSPLKDSTLDHLERYLLRNDSTESKDSSKKIEL